MKQPSFLLFVCAFLLLVCCGGGGAGVQSESNDIVFVSSKNGSADIYTVNPSGGNETRLTSWPLDEFAPIWSFDGKKIVFSSNKTGAYEVYIMDYDGNNVKQLTSIGGFDIPSSFDRYGQKILSARRVGNERKLYVISVDGTSVTNITPDGNYSNFQWSDDAQYIFAIRSESDGSGSYLYKMNADGTNLSKLFSFNVSNYSARGEWMTLLPGGENAIYVSFKSNPLVKKIDGPNNLFLIPGEGNTLNNGILYVSQTTVNGNSEQRLYIYDGEGTVGNELKAFGQSIGYGTWSMDFQYIMFYKNDGNGFSLYGMTRSGSGIRKLAENGASASWRRPSF